MVANKILLWGMSNFARLSVDITFMSVLGRESYSRVKENYRSTDLVRVVGAIPEHIMPC